MLNYYKYSSYKYMHVCMRLHVCLHSYIGMLVQNGVI